MADAVRLTTMSRNSMNSYDRNNITGASSSTTNGSLIGYPSNPPPSPATTSTHNSYPYKHYKVINQAPPTTPCSSTPCTDVCESDYTPISVKSSKKSADSCYGYMESINGSTNYKSF